jgi:hypothetical protein
MNFFDKKYRHLYNGKNLFKILNVLPLKILKELSAKYNVDKGVTVYFFHKFIKVYVLMCLLKPKYLTLRGIEEFSKSYIFKMLTGLTEFTDSGFSKATQRIPSDLVIEILCILMGIANSSDVKEQIKDKVSKEFAGDGEVVKIFDSTLISLSLKLFVWAKKENNNKGYIKISLRIDQGFTIPDRIYFDMSASSEDSVFEDLLDLDVSGVTYLFDRGFKEIKILWKICDSHNFFISRFYSHYKVEVVREIPIKERKGETLTIISDTEIRLGAVSTGNYSDRPFRLITAQNEEEEKIQFLTNRFDLSPLEIGDLYKKRWEIETFFKWLKQYLKLDKLISYTQNGALIHIYMALIVHILIAKFQKENKLYSSSLLQIMRHMEVGILNFVIISAFILGAETIIKNFWNTS